MNKSLFPVLYFIFGVTFLLAIYLLLMFISTGSLELSLIQLDYYKYWIGALSAGFGIQLALYGYSKHCMVVPAGIETAPKVTGATSAVTMVACCAHHLVDFLPILGISAFASFVGAYVEEFFMVGIAFNVVGIFYMGVKLRRAGYAKI